MNKIAVIDCDSIIFSIIQGNKVLDENNQPVKVDGKFVYTEKTEEELIASADSLMNYILTKGGFDGYVGYIKGSDTINRRKAIYPEYKANRPKEVPKNWSFIKSYLLSKWKMIEANNYEVDDYVNVTRLNLPNSHIVAIDKDLLNLEGEHFNWRKKQPDGSYDVEWKVVSNWEAQLYFWESMITGDSIDNIKGIPGKGSVYASYLAETIEKQLCTYVFDDYVDHFGEELGIAEFYKTYFTLKILDKIEGFELPEVNKI